MFHCRDLLNLPSMSRAVLLAGQGGMNRIIRWAYKPESQNFSRWVRGQELLIISAPVTQRRDYNLQKAIELAIAMHMSGAVLMTGRHYVTEVPQEVLDLANRNDFPLFSLPWDVPLLDLFEELGHAIAYDDEQEHLSDQLLSDILFGSLSEQSAAERCRELGVDPSALQQVVILDVRLQGVSGSREQMQMLQQELQQSFRKDSYPAIVVCYGSKILIFLKDLTEQGTYLKQILAACQKHVEHQLKDASYYVCVGTPCQRPADLPASIGRMIQINNMMIRTGENQRILYEATDGLYSFLCRINRPDAVKAYVEAVLGELIAYEEKYRTPLVDTLIAYFRCDCVVKKTAAYLTTHVNTVKYRLRKIENLTGRSLNDSWSVLEFHNAVILYQLL